MPNATCFFIAYALVLALELTRVFGWIPRFKRLLVRALIGLTSLALLTHTLYLLNQIFLSADASSFRLFHSWQDWGILSAWTLGMAYAYLLWKRSEHWIGLFVLHLLLALVAAAVFLPADVRFTRPSSAPGWRLVHGLAMTVGTMLITLGFAMAVMYAVQSWRLKTKQATQGSFRLPSLEYLQSYGKLCLIGSASSIGFGVLSGVIMNLTQDGRIAWLDRGILSSAGLFVWLTFASIVQWHWARRGRGEITAWMNVLSFAIVALVLVMVIRSAHGSAQDTTTSRIPSIDSGTLRVRVFE